MRLLTVVCFTILIGFGLTVDHAQAKAKHLFKIASLAPDGSIWVTKFEDFTKEVSEKTGGEVGFRVYPGGVMGDDMAMYRKMRVGQLQGGGFTMTGMASVVPDFTVMSVPFLFNSYAETDAVRTSLMPDFKEEFEKKGEDSPLFQTLDTICKKHGGLWSVEAETYLLENAEKYI